MNVTLHLPSPLAGYAHGRREIEIAVPGAEPDHERGTEAEIDAATATTNTTTTVASVATVATVFDRLADDLPALERRIRDEHAVIRRHVNVYVDGADIRTLSGDDTPVRDGATIDVIAAVSGG